jgi:osmotically-inducible protein OsmY
LQDITTLIRDYAPLMRSSHAFKVSVSSGIVKLRGNLSSHLVRRVLIDSTVRIPGVKRIEHDELYEDDEITNALAAALPTNLQGRIFIRSDHGKITMSGFLPAEELESIAQPARSMPGVVEVRTEPLGSGPNR